VFLALLGLHLWLGLLEAIFFLVSSALIMLFAASQLYWYHRFREWSAKFIGSSRWRRLLGSVAAVAYAFCFLGLLTFSRAVEPTHLTLLAAVREAPFPMWFVCSVLGFFIATLFAFADRAARGAYWLYSKAFLPSNPGPHALLSPGRRRFLEQAAYTVSAAPFVAGVYGLFYGRLNLEVTRQRIRLRRLPKAFDGFRIAQLSDIHIGPFMSAEEVRKYVAICNQQKPDLVALTGDFITWDPSTQGAAVEALSGLKAPYGIFGSLGNHEYWYEVEESITRLFAARGIRTLRQQSAPILSGGATLNLLGVDYQGMRGARSYGAHLVRRYLENIEHLVRSDTANILLSHNPNTFERAPDLGIDLSLAGHTHGGQVTLEYIHPDLSPSRLITPYAKGWFQKGAAQLYVNRGIGTIFVPMRLGAPPEITIYELVRA
jgi:hypothetical protein